MRDIEGSKIVLPGIPVKLEIGVISGRTTNCRYYSLSIGVSIKYIFL